MLHVGIAVYDKPIWFKTVQWFLIKFHLIIGGAKLILQFSNYPVIIFRLSLKVS